VFGFGWREDLRGEVLSQCACMTFRCRLLWMVVCRREVSV
jgi:hypothetical protein